MTSNNPRPGRPTIRGRSERSQATGSREPRSLPSAVRRFADDGINFGLIAAGVGFLFVVIYIISDALWGSYFGMDPGIGMTLSIGVMTLGIAVATLLWVGREIGAAARSGIHRARSDQ